MSESELIDLLKNNIEDFFVEMTKTMINTITEFKSQNGNKLYKANESALTDIWNRVNDEYSNGLKIKLKQSTKKKIIFYDD